MVPARRVSSAGTLGIAPTRQPDSGSNGSPHACWSRSLGVFFCRLVLCGPRLALSGPKRANNSWQTQQLCKGRRRGSMTKGGSTVVQQRGHFYHIFVLDLLFPIKKAWSEGGRPQNNSAVWNLLAPGHHCTRVDHGPESTKGWPGSFCTVRAT